MASEFDTTLPSIRQVQKLIKEASLVEVKLITGDLLVGKISWQDQNCLCLLSQEHYTTIWRHAIAYLKLKN